MVRIMTACILPRMKASLEIVLGSLLFFGFLWCVYPEYTSWKHLLFLLMMLGLFIYSKQSRNESWKDLGVRWDNWAPSFKILLVITLLLIIILSIIWIRLFSLNFSFYKQMDFWVKFSTYPLWAFIQQYIALAFFFRRLREVFSPHHVPAVFLSAILFSAAHLPNLPLVLFSFFGGLLWSSIYHKYNNLVVIIFFHAIMGVFLSTILMMNLSVGPWTDSLRLTKTTPVDYAVDRVNGKPAGERFSPIEIKRTDKAITVNGWVAGKNSKVETVSILLDGNAFACKYGTRREDVAAFFHNPEYAYSGFQATIPIAGIKPGTYYMKLKISLKDKRYPHYPSKKIRVKIQ